MKRREKRRVGGRESLNKAEAQRPFWGSLGGHVITHQSSKGQNALSFMSILSPLIVNQLSCRTRKNKRLAATTRTGHQRSYSTLQRTCL